MTYFDSLLRVLATADVDFVLIGGVAAADLGAARLTQDRDAVYSRDHENPKWLVDALADKELYLHGVPPGPPFRWDVETMRRGLNFTPTTSLGDLDLLGEIAGNADYETLKDRSTDLEVLGVRCRCIDFGGLIRVARSRPAEGSRSHRRARAPLGRERLRLAVSKNSDRRLKHRTIHLAPLSKRSQTPGLCQRVTALFAFH